MYNDFANRFGGKNDLQNRYTKVQIMLADRIH